MKRLITSFSSFYSSGFAKNIILLGAPGVGKGSYASRTSVELDVPHMTTGDMIRAEIKSGSDLGLEFKSYTDAGALVPDELVVALIMGQLEQVIASGAGCLLDGFPRTVPQVDSMIEAGFQLGGEESDFFAVNLTQDEEIIVEKIVNRRVCNECGENYNYAHIKFSDYEMPPLVPEVEGVCDTCGAKDSLIQRDDDKEEVVRHRLEVYNEQTAPIIEVFEELGIISEFVVDGGTKQLMPKFVELLESL